MQKAPDAPFLSKDEIYKKLLDRFEGGFCSLKDIKPPHHLKDATKASKRIAKAIRDGERVAVVGDYDVDGVSATAITVLFFKEVGHPLLATIPNRFSDGYGISTSVLERIDADLIITVDNGINAIEAAQICQNRGVDLIITDHHTPSQTLPDAYAIVNPKRIDDTYSELDICGAQVIWLLLALVKQELKLDIDMKQYLEILALAIIADVMPLTGTNRAIVQAGLKQLSVSHRASSIALRKALNLTTVSSEDVAFQIAPRLNAAGRMDDARTALEFLTSDNENSAINLFSKLNDLNSERKAVESQTSSDAILLARKDAHITVVALEGWHEGVVGIVASRLVREFAKPAIVLSINKGVAKGSARSIGRVDIYSLIASQKALLDGFGGHTMAAGLSMRVENLEQFATDINAEASKLDPDAFFERESILSSLTGDMIDFELLDILEQFEPYGESNPRPCFLATNAQILSINYMGESKDHSRVKLKLYQGDNINHNLIAFRKKITSPKSSLLTCSFTLNKNIFNNKTDIQLMLEKLYC